MIGIVVVGHGEFAKGISSTVEMVAGKQTAYESISFLEGITPESLLESIDTAINTVNQGSGVIVFTDLKGGTPHQMSIHAAMSHDGIEVLSGTNVGMILEGSIMRTMMEDVKELTLKLVTTGIEQINRFDASTLIKEDDSQEEDGI